MIHTTGSWGKATAYVKDWLKTTQSYSLFSAFYGLVGSLLKIPWNICLCLCSLLAFFFPLEKEKGFCDEPWLFFIFGVAKISAQCEGLYLRAYSIQAAHGLYCEV